MPLRKLVPPSTPLLPISRRLASAALGAVLLAGLMPAAAAVVAAPSAAGATLAPRDDTSPAGAGGTTDAGAPADPGATADTPGQLPSIAYEEWLAHEHDQIAFEPGGRVTIGFTPRADDRWPVGGGAPVALPAGRASGRQMADGAQGSRWADIGDGTGTAGPRGLGDPAPTPAPVDAPAGDATVPASGVAFTAPAPDPALDVAAASGLRRQVFGFLPYWEVSGASTKVNYDVLSTIAYFSVGADAKGNLRKKDADGTSTTGWGGWTSSSMTSVISAAHQHGTRVVLTVSVFAWNTSGATLQEALLGSSTARLNLAKQIAAAVRDRGADGVNLDFEPLASGYSDEFVAFLKTVRTELNRVRSGYQLTYDTTGYIGNYPIEASVGSTAADAIFIMGYDYRTASSSRAGSVDPLSGPAYDLADTVRSYVARVSPARVILGIPWYGRAWSTSTDGVRSTNISGAEYGYSTAVNYGNIPDLVAQYGRRWDSTEQSPYIVYRRQTCTTTYGCVTSWRQVYYDDAASMKLRYALVNDYGLRGAGMWALGYDGGRAELYRALSDSFLVDKSAPQAGIRLLAGTQFDEGFNVTWAASDVSRVVSYDVQVSVDGGAWLPWLTATRATSDVWLGSDGHGYAFRVRAKDSKGNVGAWNVSSTWSATPALAVGGFGRVTLDGLAYRTGPDTTAARLGSLPVGTIVALTSGPVSADGYTWYEVTQPIHEWSPVTFVERGVWIAVRSSTVSYVSAYHAPNAAVIDAGIRWLDFGSGGAVGAALASARMLSPNGDGSRDAIRVRWTNTVAMDSMTLNVYRTDGTLVGSRAVSDVAAGAQWWDWDGKVGSATVPDGRYVLQLVGVAGSRTYHAPSALPVTAVQVAAYGVTVDTVAPVVASATVSIALISPNGDGTRDYTKLALTATGATHWAIGIADAHGTVVRSIAGAGATVTFTWRGTDDAGVRVPDGHYAVSLLAYDDAGNSVRRVFAVTVDTTPPVVAPVASATIFSPNGDGTADTTRLSWTSNERGSGTARIWHGTTLVRSWTVTGLSSWAATWDGRTASGTPVADGRYTFRVTLSDLGGNRTVASTTVTVDRTAGRLRWSRPFYPQDADSLTPTSVLGWTLTRTATTTLRLYDSAGTLVRTVWTNRSQAAGARSWTWNGKLADGSYAPQGRYVASLTVTSSLGTLELRRAVWAAAYSVTPSATTVKPGQTLTINFATIEPLSTRPVVTFAQPGLAAVSVTASRLADGTYRATFTVRAGAAGTGTVTIAAKDTGGRTNRMSLPIAVAS